MEGNFKQIFLVLGISGWTQALGAAALVASLTLFNRDRTVEGRQHQHL